MFGDDDTQVLKPVLFDNSRDQERRNLRSKLAAILEKANTLRNRIHSDPVLSATQKDALIKRIGAATAFTSDIVDHQEEDILNFEDSICDGEKSLTSIESQATHAISAIQRRPIQEAKEELDFYSRNHHVNDRVKSIISQLESNLLNQKNPLDKRLKSINDSRIYQAIKKSNNKTREASAAKAVSTALTEITDYIHKREGNEKNPSELRKKKLAIAHSIRTELENGEKSAAQKIQAVDGILKDQANAKIFSKRGNVFKRGTENLVGRIQGFLKDNGEENAVCSYFFAPPRAAILQKSLENILDPVLSKPKT